MMPSSDDVTRLLGLPLEASSTDIVEVWVVVDVADSKRACGVTHVEESRKSLVELYSD